MIIFLSIRCVPILTYLEYFCKPYPLPDGLHNPMVLRRTYKTCHWQLPTDAWQQKETPTSTPLSLFFINYFA